MAKSLNRQIIKSSIRQSPNRLIVKSLNHQIDISAKTVIDSIYIIFSFSHFRNIVIQAICKFWCFRILISDKLISHTKKTLVLVCELKTNYVSNRWDRTLEVTCILNGVILTISDSVLSENCQRTAIRNERVSRKHQTRNRINTAHNKDILVDSDCHAVVQIRDLSKSSG